MFLTLTRVTVVICLSVCVSLSTLEATLIYSAKNGNQWTAKWYLKKLKSCKSAPLILKQLSMLAVLCSSFGHAYQSSKFISKFIQMKLSQRQESETNVGLHKNTAVKIAIKIAICRVKSLLKSP